MNNKPFKSTYRIKTVPNESEREMYEEIKSQSCKLIRVAVYLKRENAINDLEAREKVTAPSKANMSH